MGNGNPPHLNNVQLLQTRQKSPILDCNNNINCIISPTANVNAAATAAIKPQLATAVDDDIADTKSLPLLPPVLLLPHFSLQPVLSA
jgi:hypothetical protein